MKFWILGLCSALSLLSVGRANTLLFTNSGTENLSFNATATYQVVSNGSRITSQGFTTSATSLDPNPPTLTLDYSALAGTTVLDAILDLSRVLSVGTLSQSSTITHGNGTHSIGRQPTFAATDVGGFVTISGLKGGTQTVALSGVTNYNLSTHFLADLEAGDSLRITLELGDTFSTTSLASDGGGLNWKNETATYTLNQTVYGTYSAFTQVDYVPPNPLPTPEPLTAALTGAGLIGLGVLGRRRQRNRPHD
jgi:hypothetical protein